MGQLCAGSSNDRQASTRKDHILQELAQKGVVSNDIGNKLEHIIHYSILRT
jgi:SOS response regulatory protein OraA/RecX